jgi:hypothetical protein
MLPRPGSHLNGLKEGIPYTKGRNRVRITAQLIDAISGAYSTSVYS